MVDLTQVGARRLRLKGTDRRQLILDTTLSMLARRGAAATTLRGLCREMGVAPSLVTRHFAGWHEVLTATYDGITDRFMVHLTALLETEFADERARMKALI